MKMIFFLVALANVALFMWEFNTGAFEQSIENPDKDASSGLERIILVKELSKSLPSEMQNAKVTYKPEAEAALTDKVAAEKKGDAVKQNEVKDEVAASAGEGSAVRCYEAGPFPVGKFYGVWDRRLSSAGAEVKPVSRDEQAVDDYVVFFPGAETMEQSEANLEMLKNLGLKELWMVRKGEEKGQILLGIFSKEKRAIEFKTGMQAKGIDAAIRARYKNKSQKYAFIKGSDQAIASLEELKKNYPNILVKPASDSVESCQRQPMADSRTADAGDSVKASGIEAVLNKANESPSPRPLTNAGIVDAAQVKQASGKQPDEMNIAEQFDKSGKGQTEEKEKVQQICYEAGPFADEKLFDEWYKQLTAHNAEIKLLSKAPQSASDYQVYYPSAATLELSKANLDMLKSQGLNDAWMLREGSEKGQISLGVFKKEERAQAMRDQMLAKGINVEIKPRYKNRLNTLVLIKGGSGVSESLQALKKTFPGISLKSATNCSKQQSGH